MSDFSITSDIVDLPRGAWAKGHRLYILWRGRPVISLTQGDYRAYLHPVYTPAGYALTTESPPDHPHHNAIWLAADRVHCRLPFSVDTFEEAVYNFYVNETFQGRAPGRIISMSVDHDIVSETHLKIRQMLHWQGPPEWAAPEGRTLIHETRTIDIHPDDIAHVFDLRSSLSATEWDLTIGPVRHAYFGIRMTEALRGTQGAVYTDGGGRIGAAAITGETAGWIDCFGLVTQDHTAGIAVFRPPDVEPYPWQVADYGTITINPFGTGGCSLSREETIEQAIRIVTHDGDVNEAGVAERYNAFVSGKISPDNVI